MAQNVTIAGVSYSSVPAIDVPKTGGGTARFSDTIDDTVTAEHLERGYTAHDSSGAQITGTLDPGGVTPSGTRTVTANGTYDVTTLAQLVVAIPEYDGSVS